MTGPLRTTTKPSGSIRGLPCPSSTVAIAYLRKDDFDQAIVDFTEAIQLNSTSPKHTETVASVTKRRAISTRPSPTTTRSSVSGREMPVRTPTGAMRM